jgi:hypothetical protein
LNPKTTYDKSNLSATHLHELHYRQSTIPGLRQLDHPAVTSSAAILKDEGQATLDACQAWLEAWLRPLGDRQEGEVRVHAEKQMSVSFHVGKTKKTMPVFGFLSDRIWGRLFECDSDYQSALVTFFPKGAECAVAGVGLQHSLKEPIGNPKEVYDKQTADTLCAMRGRPFNSLAHGGTWHVFKWVTNHADCYRYPGTSAGEMEEQLDSFAAARQPLQEWNIQSTWIPVFDPAGAYAQTVLRGIQRVELVSGHSRRPWVVSRENDRPMVWQCLADGSATTVATPGT